MILTAVEGGGGGGGGGGGLTNLKTASKSFRYCAMTVWRELSTPQKLTLLLCDD